MTSEEKFYKALENVFIGVKIEGKGGFINLMSIKSKYYSKIKETLEKDIEQALRKYPKFRDELFDKLYSFFSRYFSENGSIYFRSTPFHNDIYEKAYSRVKENLEEYIKETLRKYPELSSELLDRIYSFFSRYFSEVASKLSQINSVS